MTITITELKNINSNNSNHSSKNDHNNNDSEHDNNDVDDNIVRDLKRNKQTKYVRDK